MAGLRSYSIVTLWLDQRGCTHFAMRKVQNPRVEPKGDDRRLGEMVGMRRPGPNGSCDRVRIALFGARARTAGKRSIALLEFSLPLVFGAGVLSFLSPCVLPLVPPYLTYMSGASFDQLRDEGTTAGALQRRVAFTSLFF